VSDTRDTRLANRRIASLLLERALLLGRAELRLELSGAAICGLAMQRDIIGRSVRGNAISLIVDRCRGPREGHERRVLLMVEERRSTPRPPRPSRMFLESSGIVSNRRRRRLRRNLLLSSPRRIRRRSSFGGRSFVARERERERGRENESSENSIQSTERTAPRKDHSLLYHSVELISSH
jgi:hypothetical protein